MEVNLIQTLCAQCLNTTNIVRPIGFLLNIICQLFRPSNLLIIPYKDSTVTHRSTITVLAWPADSHENRDRNNVLASSNKCLVDQTLASCVPPPPDSCEHVMTCMQIHETELNRFKFCNHFQPLISNQAPHI